MGNRLSKIYTRTGDDGSTGLGDGSRVAKDSLRVAAYGTVDELNSTIGMVLAADGVDAAVTDVLGQVQHALFDLGGELCIPGMVMIEDADIDRLEQVLDGFNDPLPPLKDATWHARFAVAPSARSSRWHGLKTCGPRHSGTSTGCPICCS